MRPSVMPVSIAATIELTIDAVPLVLQPAIDCIAFAIQTGVDTVAAVIESCGQRIATLDNGVIGSAIETRVHRVSAVIQPPVDALALAVQMALDALALVIQIPIPIVTGIVRTCLCQTGTHQGDEGQQISALQLCFHLRSSLE
jgi:hypothetical protein